MKSEQQFPPPIYRADKESIDAYGIPKQPCWDDVREWVKSQNANVAKHARRRAQLLTGTHESFDSDSDSP